MGIQIHKPQILSGNKTLLFVLVIALLVSVFYSFNLVLFITSLYLLYTIIGPLLDKTIFNSQLIKSFFVIFLYMVILQSVIITSWLLLKDFPLDGDIPLTFGIISLLFIARFKSLKTKSTSQPSLSVIHKFDFMAIIMSLAIFFSIIFSYHAFTDALLNNNLSFLTSGADDSAHQKMFEQKIVFNRGILYQTSQSSKVKIDNSFYPTSWHGANAAVTRAVSPHISSSNQILVAYAISKLFWFFSLLFIFCRVVIILYKRTIKNKLSLINLLWLTTSLYIVGRLTVGNMYELGAYNFVPQLISVLLTLILLLQFSKSKQGPNNQQSNLFLIAIIAIGGCISWILVLPAFCLFILLIVLLQIRATHSWSTIKALFTKPYYAVPLFILATALVIQIYIMLSTPAIGSTSFINGINLPGPIVVRGLEFYIFLITGLVAALNAFYKLNRTYFKYLLLIIGSLFAFSLFILILQLATIGTNNYYYFKVLSLLTVLILPLSITGFIFLIDTLERKKLNLAANILFIILFLLCVSFFARIILHIF